MFSEDAMPIPFKLKVILKEARRLEKEVRKSKGDWDWGGDYELKGLGKRLTLSERVFRSLVTIQ